MEVATALLVGGSDAAEIDCDGSEIQTGGTSAAATPARPPTHTSYRDIGAGRIKHSPRFVFNQSNTQKAVNC